MTMKSKVSSSLTPVKISKVDPCKFNLTKCKFEFDINNAIILEIPHRNSFIKLIIQNNGNEIKIINLKREQKFFNYQTLPHKYHKFYNYAKKIFRLLLSKTPRIIIKNDYGQFTLMKNDPNPDFEAIYKNGVSVFLKNDSKIVKILNKNGETIELNGSKINKNFDEVLKKTFIFYNSFCKKFSECDMEI
jgi:hypothetical protein